MCDPPFELQKDIHGMNNEQQLQSLKYNAALFILHDTKSAESGTMKTQHSVESSV